MSETVVENPYGLGALIAQGDIVARATLVILLVMSLLTWFIMITKFLDQRRLRGFAVEAEREFWSSTSLSDAISKLKGSGNPFRALAETGKQAFEHHELNKTRLEGAIDANEWMSEALSRTADIVISRLQSGLPVLASVGSTAPFVGLFGTVWGIYHALIAISLAGQASIDKVAGPVGEALIMTAIGLAVAVPAVLGYNVLLRRNKNVQERVTHFAHELHAYVLSGSKLGLGRDSPTTPPAGKPAAAVAR